MKKSLFFCLANCAAPILAATMVDNVTVVPGNPVSVSYSTSGDDAIITVLFSADGEPLGDAAAANAYGDVNRVVPAGSHTLYWPA